MALVSLTKALNPARDRKTLGSGTIPPYHLQSEQSTYIWRNWKNKETGHNNIVYIKGSKMPLNYVKLNKNALRLIVWYKMAPRANTLRECLYCYFWVKMSLFLNNILFLFFLNTILQIKYYI